VLLDFRGINVETVTKLRDELRKVKVEFQVVKNTLAIKALPETQMAAAKAFFEGPTAIAMSFDDPVAPAKFLSEYSKKSEFVKVKIGVVDGTAYDKTQLEELSKLPGRQELLGMFVGTLQAPVQTFVCGMNALLAQLAYAMEAVREKKEQANG
jgi:large subunit ribosomal protein L10